MTDSPRPGWKGYLGRAMGALAAGGVLTFFLVLWAGEPIGEALPPLWVVGLVILFSLPCWAVLDGMLRSQGARGGDAGPDGPVRWSPEEMGAFK